MLRMRKFIDSFNKGDLNTALNLCAAQSAIIHEFPPYLCNVSTGCAHWSEDFNAYAQKNGITDPKVILARAHIDVTEDRAYVVAPAHFTFRQKGKRSTEQGSLTVALQNVANGWRIAGWAWAKR